jgi:DNA-binding XRE family transcriptional regulator
MEKMTELERHLRRADALRAEIVRAEDVLDQLLSMRRIDPELPEGFFRTDSILPPPPPQPIAKLTPPQPDELAHAIGRRIREAREDRGWTQQDLTDRTGIARPNIARLERGAGLPNLSTLLKVASGLEMALKDLLFEQSR